MPRVWLHICSTSVNYRSPSFPDIFLFLHNSHDFTPTIGLLNEIRGTTRSKRHSSWRVLHTSRRAAEMGETNGYALRGPGNDGAQNWVVITLHYNVLRVGRGDFRMILSRPWTKAVTAALHFNIVSRRLLCGSVSDPSSTISGEGKVMEGSRLESVAWRPASYTVHNYMLAPLKCST